MKKIISSPILRAALALFSFLTIMTGCSQMPQRTAYSVPEYQQPYQQRPRQGSQQQANRNQLPPQNSPVVSNNPARNRMVNIAYSTIGVPYKWGGNSPQQGFDCSGLMAYIHKNALGMKIPRIAAKQRDYSRTITYDQLQPGDMLFFKTGTKTNHVGIYVGNRKFIHAPSGGKLVKISTMDSPYWYKRFVKFGTFI